MSKNKPIIYLDIEVMKKVSGGELDKNNFNNLVNELEEIGLDVKIKKDTTPLL